MSKTFKNATIALVHTDDATGKAKRIKSIPYLIENADDTTVQAVAQALKPLLKKDVSGAIVTNEYTYTIA